MAKGNPKKKKKRLKKDARSEKKEQKIEKKEQKKFLGEEIEDENIHKEAKETDEIIAEIYTFIVNLNKNIEQYQALIQEYLKTQNPQFTSHSQAYSERIADDLKEIFELTDDGLDHIKQNKKDCKGFSKYAKKLLKFLKQEEKVLRKQKRNLTKSAREKNELQEAEKEAIIQRKSQVNQELQRVNEELIKILEKVIEKILDKDIEDLGGLLDHRKDIKKKWKKKGSSWKSLYKILNELTTLLGKKGEFFINLKLRNRKVIIANNQIDELLKEAQKYIADKQILDKQYDQMLINEEIEAIHEKEMGKIIDAM